jgi:hypothetical protein
VDALLGEILREFEGEVGRAMEGLEGMEREIGSMTGRGKDGAGEGEGGEKGEGKGNGEEEVEAQRREACTTLLERWRRIGEVVEWALGLLQGG